MSGEEYKYDEIGVWSEIKLDIIREYAQAYSIILRKQREKLHLKHIYIDAFSGGGKHKAKKSGTFIDGSPIIALSVNPPFSEYHFIDLDRKKINALTKASKGKNNVYVYNNDCNEILMGAVFPRARWGDYKRALCILDPYGLHLDWKVIEAAGKMKSIEIFLNFPIADINRNVLRRNNDKIVQSQADRLTRFWGDESWKEIAYCPSRQQNIWGKYDTIKTNNDTVAEAFRQRLIRVAGFKKVPRPIPMKNNQGATVYYLFFASQKPVAMDIVKSIFKKYST